jgi:hypothetical protein
VSTRPSPRLTIALALVVLVAAGCNHPTEGGAGAAGSGAGGGGGGGAGGTAVVAATPPAISGLSITPNPNNALSCIVTWTTDVLGSSEVQFGAAQYQFQIVDGAGVTAHKVLVIGMRAETATSSRPRRPTPPAPTAPKRRSRPARCRPVCRSRR